MTLFLITFEDGTQDTVSVADAAFGVPGVEFHGPVVAAQIAPSNPTFEREDDYLPHTRLSRQMLDEQREVPIYGTGRTRRVA